MKALGIISALLVISSAPALADEVAPAQNNCDAIKSDIEQRIINNGVPADGFTLTVVANDQQDQATGKEVGHCGHGHYKIFYSKHANH